MENIKDSWQHKFLTKGTEFGCGDLSIMISTVSSLLQEQRQRMAKEIEGEFRNTRNLSSTYFNSGLQAALNIVLGEGEKIINELNKNEH